MSWNGLPTVTLIDGSEAVLVEDLRAGPGLREAARVFLDHVEAASLWRVPGVGCDGHCTLADTLRAALAATEEPGLDVERLEAAWRDWKADNTHLTSDQFEAAMSFRNALARQEARDGE